jgi:transposase
MRRLYATGRYSHREIALRFGVGTSTAQLAINGRRFSHITDVPPVTKRTIAEKEAA